MSDDELYAYRQNIIQCEPQEFLGFKLTKPTGDIGAVRQLWNDIVDRKLDLYHLLEHHMIVNDVGIGMLVESGDERINCEEVSARLKDDFVLAPRITVSSVTNCLLRIITIRADFEYPLTPKRDLELFGSGHWSGPHCGHAYERFYCGKDGHIYEVPLRMFGAVAHNVTKCEAEQNCNEAYSNLISRLDGRYNPDRIYRTTVCEDCVWQGNDWKLKFAPDDGSRFYRFRNLVTIRVCKRESDIIMTVAALCAETYIVSIKMPDGSITTFELASVPKPDENGMFRFHNKHGGDIIVHASNVWIEEKSNKGKSKK